MIEITCGGLLFDLDGVLVDSTAAVTRVWSRWAKEHGLDPEQVIKISHGRPTRETILELLPYADQELENRRVESGETFDTSDVVALPGTHALLRSLPPDRWTIVTSCSPGLAKARLRAAGFEIPEKMVTCNDIQNGKPHPEPYLTGAQRLGIRPESCVVLEDVPAGIRSGKAAGARVIAVRTTAPVEELRTAKADWIVVGCKSISAKSNGSGLLLMLSESY